MNGEWTYLPAAVSGACYDSAPKRWGLESLIAHRNGTCKTTHCGLGSLLQLQHGLATSRACFGVFPDPPWARLRVCVHVTLQKPPPVTRAAALVLQGLASSGRRRHAVCACTHACLHIHCMIQRRSVQPAACMHASTCGVHHHGMIMSGAAPPTSAGGPQQRSVGAAPTQRQAVQQPRRVAGMIPWAMSHGPARLARRMLSLLDRLRGRSGRHEWCKEGMPRRCSGLVCRVGGRGQVVSAYGRTTSTCCVHYLIRCEGRGGHALLPQPACQPPAPQQCAGNLLQPEVQAACGHMSVHACTRQRLDQTSPRASARSACTPQSKGTRPMSSMRSHERPAQHSTPMPAAQ